LEGGGGTDGRKRIVGVTSNRHLVSILYDENVLELDYGDVVQVCEYAFKHC
jgi:hypothetical protein